MQAPLGHVGLRLRCYSTERNNLESKKSDAQTTREAASSDRTKAVVHENIYTIPNFLTVSRIVSCPFLGYFIVQGDFKWATGLLFYAGVSDWVSHCGLLWFMHLPMLNPARLCLQVDGFLARRYNMGTVFGSILDPAADKALMTTLTIALAMRGLLPGEAVGYCSLYRIHDSIY